MKNKIFLTLFMLIQLLSLEANPTKDLCLAVKAGSLDGVTAALAAGADYNYQNPKTGNTPLIVACREGHTPLVLKLLIAGASANIVNLHRERQNSFFNYETALFQKGALENLEIFDLLYLFEADLHHQNDDGETPLIKALKFSHRDNAPSCMVAKKLIRLGADVNKQDNLGYTPLMWAVRNKLKEVILLLLSFGADTMLVDNNGKTAATLVEKLGRQNLFSSDDPMNISMEADENPS